MTKSFRSCPSGLMGPLLLRSLEIPTACCVIGACLNWLTLRQVDTNRPIEKPIKPLKGGMKL